LLLVLSLAVGNMKWTLLLVLSLLVASALARTWVSEEQQFRNWMKIHNKQLIRG